MCSQDISECSECGSANLEHARQENELVCAECGFVLSPSIESDPAVEGSTSTGVERSQPPTETVVVALINQPDETYQKYYRIEDAEEFFHNCWGNEREMEKRIAESDIEPFATLDVPQPDWVISM